MNKYFLIIAVLLMSLLIPAFADESEGDDYALTVDVDGANADGVSERGGRDQGGNAGSISLRVKRIDSEHFVVDGAYAQGANDVQVYKKFKISENPGIFLSAVGGNGANGWDGKRYDTARHFYRSAQGDDYKTFYEIPSEENNGVHRAYSELELKGLERLLTKKPWDLKGTKGGSGGLIYLVVNEKDTDLLQYFRVRSFGGKGGKKGAQLTSKIRVTSSMPLEDPRPHAEHEYSEGADGDDGDQGPGVQVIVESTGHPLAYYKKVPYVFNLVEMRVEATVSLNPGTDNFKLYAGREVTGEVEIQVKNNGMVPIHASKMSIQVDGPFDPLKRPELISIQSYPVFEPGKKYDIRQKFTAKLAEQNALFFGTNKASSISVDVSFENLEEIFRAETPIVIERHESFPDLVLTQLRDDSSDIVAMELQIALWKRFVEATGMTLEIYTVTSPHAHRSAMLVSGVETSSGSRAGIAKVVKLGVAMDAADVANVFHMLAFEQKFKALAKLLADLDADLGRGTYRTAANQKLDTRLYINLLLRSLFDDFFKDQSSRQKTRFETQLSEALENYFTDWGVNTYMGAESGFLKAASIDEEHAEYWIRFLTALKFVAEKQEHLRNGVSHYLLYPLPGRKAERVSKKTIDSLILDLQMQLKVSPEQFKTSYDKYYAELEQHLKSNTKKKKDLCRLVLDSSYFRGDELSSK